MGEAGQNQVVVNLVRDQHEIVALGEIERALPAQELKLFVTDSRAFRSHFDKSVLSVPGIGEATVVGQAAVIVIRRTDR